MFLKQLSPPAKHKSWLLLSLAMIILLGIFLRFYNLDLKVYWTDEIINANYAAGYTEMQLDRQVQRWNGQIIGPENLLAYQLPSRDSTSLDVVRALAVEEPQSPPLYYLSLRWWMKTFGTSVATRRSLSACFSVAALVLLYLLCLVLFKSATVGWVAAALAAVSPIHLVYAQEARYYAAWTAAILLSTLMLVLAVQKNQHPYWIAYCLANIIGLYTYPLTITILLVHGLYICSLYWLNHKKVCLKYLISSGVSLFAYSPWLYFIAVNSHKMQDWRQTEIPLRSLILSWFSSLEIAFLDLHKTHLSYFQQLRPLAFDLSLKALIGLIFIYSLYALSKRISDKSTVILIYSLIFLPWASLALPDLLLGGVRSIIHRYLIPSYLGIQIAAAYMFSRSIENKSLSRIKRKVELYALSFLISISSTSCLYYQAQETWWSKSLSVDNPEIADIVNDADNPLIVTQMTGSDGRGIVSLAYSLDKTVKLQIFYKASDLSNFDSSFNDIYLYGSSDTAEVLASEEDHLSLQPVYEGFESSLYQIVL